MRTRQRVAETVTGILGAGWDVVPNTVKALNTIRRPTVYIEFNTISPENAPVGEYVDGCDIALVSHLEDYTKAEDFLDDAVRPFLDAIDERDDINWTAAEKRAIGSYLGWVITVNLLTHTTPGE